MSDVSRFAIVWTAGELPYNFVEPGYVGLMLAPSALPCDLLVWKGENVPDLSGYDALLVTVFGIGERHISQIRARYPHILIVAWPDPPVEHAFAPESWDPRYETMLAEIAQADYIAAHTPDGGEMAVYVALTGVPLVQLSTVVVTDTLRALRDVPKADYLLTTGHFWCPHYVAANVAACALVQQATGIPVVYVAETEQARDLARIAGLRADFRGRVSPKDFADLAARARVGIDLYPMHAVGRAGVLCAAVGTPCVGSNTNGGGSVFRVDPWRPDLAAAMALTLLDNPAVYASVRKAGIEVAEACYSIETLRRAVDNLINEGAAKRARSGQPWWKLAAENTPAALDAFYQHTAVLDRSYFTGRMDLYEIVADAALPYLNDGSLLVDVGCGTGELFPALRARANGMTLHLLGLDQSRHALALARAQTPDAGFRVGDFLHADALPWGAADVVTCTEVLEHQSDPATFLARLAKLTRPGGTLILTVPNGAVDTWEGHRNFWTAEAFTELLAPLGGVTVEHIRDGQTLLAVVTLGVR